MTLRLGCEHDGDQVQLSCLALVFGLNFCVHDGDQNAALNP